MGAPLEVTGSRRVLVVMAKQPAAGQVKTRLAPAIGLEGAARLYGAFLADLLDRFGRLVGVERRVAAWPPGSDPVRGHARASAWGVIDQIGEGLGERMEHAFRTQLPPNGCMVLIGSDAPLLPARRVLAAFRRLEAACVPTVVLAPDAGGGYCVVGMRGRVPGLFGVRMSTASVFEETAARVRLAGAELVVLAEGWDVDVPADLERLRVALRRPRARRLAPATARALDALDRPSSHLQSTL